MYTVLDCSKTQQCLRVFPAFRLSEDFNAEFFGDDTMVPSVSHVRNSLTHRSDELRSLCQWLLELRGASDMAFGRASAARLLQLRRRG